MSYKQKCLEIDPGLRCQYGTPLIRSYFWVTSNGKMIAFGKSAASAWKAAWEKLRGKS